MQRRVELRVQPGCMIIHVRHKLRRRITLFLARMLAGRHPGTASARLRRTLCIHLARHASMSCPRRSVLSTQRSSRKGCPSMWQSSWTEMAVGRASARSSASWATNKVPKAFSSLLKQHRVSASRGSPSTPSHWRTISDGLALRSAFLCACSRATWRAISSA